MIELPVERAAIERLLPHRDPFLFVDRVVALSPDRSIRCERGLNAGEGFFAGHFPGNPILPGVLITEALAQSAGLLLALSAVERGEDAAGRLFYLAKADMKWTEPARPGETLTLEAAFERDFGRLTVFRVRASVGRRDVAAGSLTLARVG